MRRLLVAALALVVLVACAAAVNLVLPLPGGPLSTGGDYWGSPERAGKPLTASAFLLHNDGERRLAIEEIRLPEVDGIDYLGAVVRRPPGGPGFPVADGFPPTDPELAVRRVRAAEGFELGPHDSEYLLLGLEGVPGDYTITKVEVDYRMELLGGLGPRFRRELTTRLGLCLREGEQRPSCDPPGLPD